MELEAAEADAVGVDLEVGEYVCRPEEEGIGEGDAALWVLEDDDDGKCFALADDDDEVVGSGEGVAGLGLGVATTEPTLDTSFIALESTLFNSLVFTARASAGKGWRIGFTRGIHAGLDHVLCFRDLL